MDTILNEILENRDLEYREFHKKLIPNIEEGKILGLRSAIAHTIAKKYANTSAGEDFLHSLPHRYYDENIVHAFMLGRIKKDKGAIKDLITEFLPYVDNWAVCDGLCAHLKSFFKSPEDVYDFVLECVKSKEPYTIRFGLVCLLDYYISDTYIDDILSICKSVKSEEYYVNMAIAWLISFCLIKEYEKTISLIEKRTLDKWVHNKSIQKALESYRVPLDKKDYLRSLKIK